MAEPALALPGSDASEAAEPSLGPLDAVVDDALAPIDGAAAGGEDLTYDSAFEGVKAQIGRINAVDARIDQERALQGKSLVVASDGPDFARVAATARALLHERSKDFRLAGYLTLALAETDGVPGMAAGLRVLAGLVEQYWADAYPPVRRLRGRLAMLTFLNQHLSQRLAASPPEARDRPALEAARGAIGRIHAGLEHHTADGTAHLLGVRIAVEEALRRLPTPETQAQPPRAPAQAEAPPPFASDTPVSGTPREAVEAPPAAAAAPAPSSAPAPTPAAAAPIAEARTPTEAWRAVLQACAVLREAQPAGAAAFRLARAVRWDELDAPPPHQNGTTRIEAPPGRRRDYLRRLAERGEWVTLVQEGETAFCEHPYQFWLDLQRLLASALEGAGPAYASARAVVAEEAGRLVARLPGLAGLAYSDGTPFADPATQQWLEALARAPGTRPTAATDTDTDGGEGARAEAQRLAAAGELGRGARVLQEAAAQAGSERARFGLELALARLFADAGRPAMARPLLDALDRESEARGLDRWEPAAALDVAALRFRCLVALSRSGFSDGSHAEPDRAALERAAAERAAVFDRLCRLDAQRALELAAWAGEAS